MGYLKGFFTTLGLTYPSFLFIHIYLEGLSVQAFFQDMINNSNWALLMDVCETAIVKPLSAFFAPRNAITIVLVLLPWIVTAFIVSFFFRKKHGARGGLFTIALIFLSIQIANYLVFQGGTFTVSMLTQPNLFYGFLVVFGLTLLIGLISGLISPFKKGQPTEKIKVPRLVAEPQAPAPYYMPTESPSRDQYMETQQPLTSPPSQNTGPLTCQYCGSYIDADSEFCSVCGNRIYTQ